MPPPPPPTTLQILSPTLEGVSMTPPNLGQEEVALESGGGEFELGLTLASQKTSHSGQNQKKLLSRQFLLAYAVAQTTLVSGVVYGWPALRKALKDNNVLRQRCDNDEDDDSLESCKDQEQALGVIFAAGSWAVQGCRLAFGLIRDKYGTRSTASACLLIVSAGAVLFAVAKDDNLPLLAIGFFLMGSGSGVQLCVQGVGSLFGKSSGMATSVLSGSFTASAAVLLLCSAAMDLGASRRATFLCYGALVFLSTALAWVWLPKTNDFNEIADAAPATDHRVADKGEKQKSRTLDAGAHAPPTPPTLRDQLLSLDFALLVCWFTAMLIPIQYWVISIGNHLESYGDDGSMARWSTAIWTVSSLGSPISGALCDRYGVGFTIALSLSLVAVAFGILMSQSLDAQWSMFIIFNQGRLAIFACYFIYIGKRFGYVHYGTLAGTGLFVTSVSSFTLPPLFGWGLNHGWSGPDALSLGIIVTLLLYPAYVSFSERSRRRASLSVGFAPSVSLVAGTAENGVTNQPAAAEC